MPNANAEFWAEIFGTFWNGKVDRYYDLSINREALALDQGKGNKLLDTQTCRN